MSSASSAPLAVVKLTSAQVETARKYGPYLLKECIGSGAHGTVYLAVHEKTGVTRVLKVIIFDRKGGGKEKSPELKAVEAEMNVGTTLGKQCPFLVEYEEVVVRGGECFILMEHCAGGNLASLITARIKENRPFTEEEVARFLFEVGSALAALHASSIAHRDVKPTNIFLLADGTHKLGDYSIARFVSDQNTMSIVGSNGYIAPEVLSGETDYTVKVDVYSLGCVLYEMLALRHPFRNDRGVLNIFNISLGKPNPIPAAKAGAGAGTGTGLVQLALRMMAVDPTARPSMEEVLASPPVAFLASYYVTQERATIALEKKLLTEGNSRLHNDLARREVEEADDLKQKNEEMKKDLDVCKDLLKTSEAEKKKLLNLLAEKEKNRITVINEIKQIAKKKTKEKKDDSGSGGDEK